MSLKREIAKLEQVEEMEEMAELTEERRQAEQRSIDEKLVSLYRRIDVIVDYIDREDKATTITEEQLKEDEQHFIEEGIRKAWELKNLELVIKIKNLERILKEQETREGEKREKAFQDGVNARRAAEERIDESIDNAHNRWQQCLKEANGDLEKARELYDKR